MLVHVEQSLLPCRTVILPYMFTSESPKEPLQGACAPNPFLGTLSVGPEWALACVFRRLLHDPNGLSGSETTFQGFLLTVNAMNAPFSCRTHFQTKYSESPCLRTVTVALGDLDVEEISTCLTSHIFTYDHTL